MRTNHIPRITDDFKMDVTKTMIVIMKGMDVLTF